VGVFEPVLPEKNGLGSKGREPIELPKSRKLSSRTVARQTDSRRKMRRAMMANKARAKREVEER